MMRKLFLFLLTLVTAAPLWAAEVSLSAQTDKTALTLDDELTLTIELSGVRGNMVMPQLPSLPAFNVYAQQVDSASINNNTTLTFRYAMTPRFAGKTVIGPVTFTYKGKTYRTAPIDITVYRAGTQKPAAGANKPALETIPENLPPLTRALMTQAQQHAGQDFFLISVVQNKSPYVNQPVLLGIRFYYAQAFDEGPYTEPSVTNIFMEDLGSTQGTQTIAGKKYYYVEQRHLITAPSAGKATVGPASVQFTVSRIPGLSRFDHLLGGLTLGETRTVKSAPITLNVLPLPTQDRPNSFYGAVGEGYTLTAQTDRQQVEAGEAVNLSVTVTGPGHLKTTSDLNFPDMPGLRRYDADASSGPVPGKGNDLSYKTFKTVLVPSASGTYTIPSLEWSYFNPKTRKYHSLHTQPITLTVTPATRANAALDFRTSQTDGGFRALNRDVAYVKTQPAPEAANWLTRVRDCRALTWLFAAWLAAGALYRLLDKKALLQKRAYAQARAQLKQAEGAQDVAAALADYLNHKCALSAASTPLKELARQLQTHGSSAETARDFALFWQQLDAARFAPVAMGLSGHEELTRRAEQLLKRLEGELQCRA